MANRLTKITTRTGDQGTTGLGDGARVSKAAPRVHALGDIDELNSAIGVLVAMLPVSPHRDVLLEVPTRLFDLGAEVSIPTHRALRASAVASLDAAAASLNAKLPPLKEFVLPGGSTVGAYVHLVRTVARRAERSLVELATREDVSPVAIQFLNRLSDFLFVLARNINRESGLSETLWTRAMETGK